MFKLNMVRTFEGQSTVLFTIVQLFTWFIEIKHNKTTRLRYQI